MTRRTANLAAVYLLLGLAATWAVAWGLALAFRCDSRVGSYILPEPPHFLLLVGRCSGGVSAKLSESGGWMSMFPLPLDQQTAADQIPPDVLSQLGLVEDPESDRAFANIMVESRGLPWRALRSHTRCPVDLMPFGGGGIEGYRRTGLSELRGGKLIAGPSQTAGGIVLPCLPYWPGLIADTLFYALLFAGLHQLTAWGRRARRRRRNRCTACGYDLQGLNSPTCPECGRALSPARGATATPDRA